jgi:hypothetical protein
MSRDRRRPRRSGCRCFRSLHRRVPVAGAEVPRRWDPIKPRDPYYLFATGTRAYSRQLIYYLHRLHHVKNALPPCTCHNDACSIFSSIHSSSGLRSGPSSAVWVAAWQQGEFMNSGHLASPHQRGHKPLLSTQLCSPGDQTRTFIHCSPLMWLLLPATECCPDL